MSTVQRRVLTAVVVLLLLGAVFIACALGLVPYLTQQKLNKNMKLTDDDTEAYSTWLNAPAPIYMNFYFFNVTNAQQFIDNASVRPHVRQIGPYVYREVRNKTAVEWINGGATLRYRQHKWFVFDANRSCGCSENDTFTHINIPLVTIASYLRFAAGPVQHAASLAVKYSGLQLFEQHSVYQLLWGYQPKFPSLIQHLLTEIDMLPTWGIYVGATANGTDDGEYEIETGQTDISQLGHVTSWKQSRSLPFWTDPNCNMLNGTDGTFWHPMISSSERLYIFNSDLCRSLYITSDATESIVAGVTTLHFTPPTSVFASPAENPDNRGFCTPASDCLLAGVLNITRCRDAPVVLSMPHFYQADPSYQQAIDGLTPNITHLTYLDIEPNTGYVLKAEKKIQINVYLRKTEVIRDTRHLQNSVIFPVMWLNENVVIGEETGQKLKTQVIDMLHMAQIVGYCLLAVGCLLVSSAAIILAVFLYQRRCLAGSVHVQLTSGTAAAAAAGDDDAQLIDAGSTA